MKATKLFKLGLIAFLISFASGYSYLVYSNDLDIQEPSPKTIQVALDNSINWVVNNQTELLKVNNPALWSFLNESAILTNNNELAKLVREYRHRSLGNQSVWNGYFFNTPPFDNMATSLLRMEKYQKFLVYGLTCDSDLSDDEHIQEQLDISFCDWKPYYSSCSTHQLMGIRLLQEKSCNNQDLYSELSTQLIDMIQKQIKWDPRVGDVYMQRVMMLLESGHFDKVKPIWIQRILNEQRGNGGWANFYHLINVTDSLEFGFGYKFPEFRSNPKASFHTTAQAVYVLSMINAKYN